MIQALKNIGEGLLDVLEGVVEAVWARSTWRSR